MTTSADPAAVKEPPHRVVPGRRLQTSRSSRVRSSYPLWFFIPTMVLYVVLFAVPTFSSFYFSLTRWNLFTGATFIGLDNFILFFSDAQLLRGFTNTFIYAVVTTGLKVVLGIGLAQLLTSQIVARGYLRTVIFFPVLVSTIGIGITFQVLMDPFGGLINSTLAFFGITGPGWLTDPSWALFSVALVDVWKGVGIATLIFMAGIVAIPQEYFEAAKMDGASAWQNFWTITLPLARPATATVVVLALIGGLRSFDLIWAMTKGGPGFTSDVIASVIFKQYQSGYMGLSTAGNVVLFIVVTAIVLPINFLLNRKEVDR